MSIKMVKNLVCNNCNDIILRPDEKASDVLCLSSARMIIFSSGDAFCVKKEVGPFHFCNNKCLIDFMQSNKSGELNILF